MPIKLHFSRNLSIFVILLASLPVLPAVADEPSAETKPDNWTVLFDGSSLDHWRGYKSEERPAGWVIEDGTLCRKTGGDDLTTVESFDDFELELEWKVAEASNSGIIYRARLGDGAPYISGLEYQVLEDKHADARSPLTHAGSLYALYPTKPELCKPTGEWNKTRILVKGNHVEHWLNGEKVVECELWSDDWNQRLAKSKFNGWKQFGKSPQGHIALQDHGDPVWYRNIRIRKPAE